MLDKFTGFFCFASFYIKPFFGAILKSPKRQEIAVNISESSRRRTPDPLFLFIAYTMQSLPALWSINQTEQYPQLTLHMYLQWQEEGPAWGTNGEEIPSQDPFSALTTGWCNESVTVIPWHTWLPLPFWPALAAHLFSPLTLHLLLPLSE